VTPTEIEAAAPGDERRVLEWLATELVDGPDSTFDWGLWYRRLNAEAHLDAAMMLVPDGWQWDLSGGHGVCGADIGTGVVDEWDAGQYGAGIAATPALALCAAIAKGIE
jgi:hypothetical protein